MNSGSSWWPPKVGDILRHFTLHGEPPKQVHAKLHVLAVFEHDGKVLAATAEWFPTRQRWHYEIYRDTAAIVGSIWPDSEAPRHEIRQLDNEEP